MSLIASNRFGSVSQTATNSAPKRDWLCLTWCFPMFPSPTTAIFILLIGEVLYRTLNGVQARHLIRWYTRSRMKPELCATKANSRTTSSEQPNCRRDEGGPLGAAVQAEATNHPLGFCEAASLRDAASSPAGLEGRRPSKSKLCPPPGRGWREHGSGSFVERGNLSPRCRGSPTSS